MKNFFFLFTLLLLTGCSSIDYEELLKDHFALTYDGNMAGSGELLPTFPLCIFMYDSEGKNITENNLPLTEWNVEHSGFQSEPCYIVHNLVEIHQYLDGDSKELPFYNTMGKELRVVDFESLSLHHEGEKYILLHLLTAYGNALDMDGEDVKEHVYRVTIKCLPIFGDEKTHEIIINLKSSVENIHSYKCTKLTFDGKPLVPFNHGLTNFSHTWGITINK